MLLLSPNQLHLSLSPSPKFPKRYASPLFPFPRILPSKNPSKTLIRSSKPDTSSAKTLPQSAIQRIADKLRSLGFTEDPNPNPNPKTHISESDCESKSAGEIFIPLPNQLAKYRVGSTLDPSWSTPEYPVPAPGSGEAIGRWHELKKEVKREREAKKGEGKAPSLAELSLSKEELKRLRSIGILEKRKLKVGKAGITEGIVNGIHERWRKEEVVKIVCEDLCRMNMKRTHDLLERKTGGLVVWRSGSKIVLYRGSNYKYPYFLSDNNSMDETSPSAAKATCLDSVEDRATDDRGSCSSHVAMKSSNPSPSDKMVRPSLIQGVGVPNRVRFQLPGEAQLEEEADRLLDGLGPRFTDWWGCDPLPVDADLLPATVPGYRKPFRLLPYGIKSKLTNDEMTALKRLGRPLPCHFALGRNRKLQGLASSIVKLWEKCEIAKIAVKRGVQNTNSEMMAEELKWLTGGTLLSRDREFIVLYRGKDFLPSAVSSVIQERRKHALNGIKQQVDSSRSGETAKKHNDEAKIFGPINEPNCTNGQRHDHQEQTKLRSIEAAIKRTSIKLSMAVEKKEKAEKLLAELEKEEVLQQPDTDKEGITEEERYMLRKVGLRMGPFLLMGRRGVFDGTIENMHLHWKYRELVKVISKEKSPEAVRQVARTLEVESGGILVAVERVRKGYAIIVYRGKNYRRPSSLRPSTLLSKREAMKRSLEAQRQESLKLHVLKLNRNVEHLKLELDKDNEAHKLSDELSFQTRGNLAADSSSINSNERLDAPVNCEQPTERGIWDDVSSMLDGNEAGKSEPEYLSESMSEDNSESLYTGITGGPLDSGYHADNLTSEGRSFSPIVHDQHCASSNEATESTVESPKNEFEESVSTLVDGKSEISSRVHLSNRDRLLLRKQALKMKKRPVLAVGRSNIVTGVAKTINAHFKKYPLAIVNVKGRAKGTSVQEVVFKLEQATGAVLVSQEPSKIILYRGWGAEDGPGHKGKKNARNAGKTSVGAEVGAVSPELMAAIKLECGLQNNQEKKLPPLP